MPTAKKSALGRGLDSLFEENGGLDEQTAALSQVKLRVMDLEPNREQPRQLFNEESLTELSRSIAEHGVLQPILVRPQPSGAYQIIAGERRWRAARAAGLAEVPVVIRDFTDEEAMAAALIENLQREDLNPMEEAAGYQQLMDAFDLTQEEVSRRLGKSRSAVGNALRLLNLPDGAMELVREGKLSAGHARALLALDYLHSSAERIAEEVVAGELSVRETERLVKRENAVQAPPDVSADFLYEPRRASFYDEVQLSLEQCMGRRVKVETRGKNENGTLVIDFHNQEDLQRIAKLLETV
ncbi:MAG: ParB/RepB/Spo0J family partition protein [Oscillospiraceae bacterium]|nr:ParB/RepB/Spo0J family partition protein [Oscillospiraceae bacterium]